MLAKCKSRLRPMAHRPRQPGTREDSLTRCWYVAQDRPRRRRTWHRLRMREREDIALVKAHRGERVLAADGRASIQVVLASAFAE
jgi:hypothetical protein